MQKLAAQREERKQNAEAELFAEFERIAATARPANTRELCTFIQGRGTDVRVGELRDEKMERELALTRPAKREFGFMIVDGAWVALDPSPQQCAAATEMAGIAPQRFTLAGHRYKNRKRRPFKDKVTGWAFLYGTRPGSSTTAVLATDGVVYSNAKSLHSNSGRGRIEMYDAEGSGEVQTTTWGFTFVDALRSEIATSTAL